MGLVEHHACHCSQHLNRMRGRGPLWSLAQPLRSKQHGSAHLAPPLQPKGQPVASLQCLRRQALQPSQPAIEANGGKWGQMTASRVRGWRRLKQAIPHALYVCVTADNRKKICLQLSLQLTDSSSPLSAGTSCDLCGDICDTNGFFRANPPHNTPATSSLK